MIDQRPVTSLTAVYVNLKLLLHAPQAQSLAIAACLRSGRSDSTGRLADDVIVSIRVLTLCNGRTRFEARRVPRSRIENVTQRVHRIPHIDEPYEQRRNTNPHDIRGAEVGNDAARN